MTTLTGSDVWNASLEEESFAEEMPEGGPVREIIRPYIEAAPTVLADYLEKPLTLQVLADTKIAFLRYCMDNGFAEKMGEAVGFSGEIIEVVLSNLVEALAGMLEDIPGMLEEQGVTEQQVMLNKKVGLNSENKKLYKAGALTVEQVLRTQPSVIVKNS